MKAGRPPPPPLGPQQMCLPFVQACSERKSVNAGYAFSLQVLRRIVRSGLLSEWLSVTMRKFSSTMSYMKQLEQVGLSCECKWTCAICLTALVFT